VGAAANSYIVRLLYLVCSVSALLMQLITLVSATLLSMLAPGLALRGPDGSMHTAVDGMKDEILRAVQLLLIGMYSMLTSVALYCWLVFPAMEAAILTVMVVFVSWAIHRRRRGTYATFQIPKDQEVTGKYEAHEAANAGADAGVVSKGELATLSHLISREQHLKTAAVGASSFAPAPAQTRGLVEDDAPGNAKAPAPASLTMRLSL